MSDNNDGKNDKNFQKRKYLRYPPNPLEVGLVDSNPNRPTFQPDYVGIILEESAMGGCCLCIREPDLLKVGTKCRVKIGDLQPFLSQVRWARSQEMGLIIMGFHFLE